MHFNDIWKPKLAYMSYNNNNSNLQVSRDQYLLSVLKWVSEWFRRDNIDMNKNWTEHWYELNLWYKLLCQKSYLPTVI